MKCINTLILLIGGFQLLFCQQTISGTVVDAATNEPLFRARISVRGDWLGYEITGGGGTFSIEIEPGLSELEISCYGYKIKRYQIQQKTDSLIIKLHKDPYRLQLREENAQKVPSTPNEENVITTYYPSIVRINAHKDFGEDIGTGMIIGHDGNHVYLLTALHVVKEASKVEILLHRQEQKYLASVVNQDDQLDLAILKITCTNLPHVATFYPSAPNRLKMEAAVKSVGHPGGGFWKPNALNKIQEEALYEDERKFGISPQAIVGGCSGGPVFLESLAWVGMIVETSMVEGKCVKAEVIMNWIQKLGIPNQFLYRPDLEMIKVDGQAERQNLEASYVSKSLLNDIQPAERWPDLKTNDFYLAKYELTIAQFHAFVVSSGYETTNEREGKTLILRQYEDEYGYLYWGHDTTTNITYLHDAFGNRIPKKDWDKYPVIHVSWEDAVAYCKWLSSMTGFNYRLPSKEELMIAQMIPASKKGHPVYQENTCDLSFLCDSSLFISGSHCNEFDLYKEKYGEDKWTNDGYPTIAPIGQFKASASGFYDLFGNVSEWCNELEGFFINGRMRYGRSVSFGPNYLDWVWEYVLEVDVEKGTRYVDDNEGKTWYAGIPVYEKCLRTKRFPLEKGQKITNSGAVLLNPSEIFFNLNYSGVFDHLEFGIVMGNFEKHISSNHTGIRVARDN